ncbi:MAG: CsbD family protein [Bacillus sp. (in: Bacteria)]|nr:CsbD family protein [Bacillus sp. (in: firmicutes)]
MNKDNVKGNVDKLKGAAKEQWGKLTNDQGLESQGKSDKLKGKVKVGIGAVKDSIKTISKQVKK